MANCLKDLNVQVLKTKTVPVYKCNGAPHCVNTQLGFYCVDPAFPNLVRDIVSSDRNDGEAAKTLSVQTGDDNVYFHQDRFEIVLDARGFAPEEIRCIVLNRYVEILGRIFMPGSTEVVRNMSRKYVLPQTVIPERSECFLVANGALIVRAPWAPY